MITIICGEDTTTARQYLVDQIEKARSSGAEIRRVSPKELEEEIRDGGTAATLFHQMVIYQTSGLLGYLAKKRQKKQQLEVFSADQSISILDWEGGKSAYTLGLKKEPFLKEFRPSADIFSLLDAIVPGNRRRFVSLLGKILTYQEPIFVYTMLHRRVRSLIVLNVDPAAEKLHPFQKRQMEAQAKKWPMSELLRLYEGLFRIDQTLKTNGSSLSVRQSLEILACFYV